MAAYSATFFLTMAHSAGVSFTAPANWFVNRVDASGFLASFGAPNSITRSTICAALAISV